MTRNDQKRHSEKQRLKAWVLQFNDGRLDIDADYCLHLHKTQEEAEESINDFGGEFYAECEPRVVEVEIRVL